MHVADPQMAEELARALGLIQEEADRQVRRRDPPAGLGKQGRQKGPLHSAEAQLFLQTFCRPMVIGAPVAKKDHEQYHNPSDADRKRFLVVH